MQGGVTVTNSVPRPTTIERLRFGAYMSFAMLAGMDLDVFTPLQDGHLSAEQIADTLEVGTEKLRPLLYALVAGGLLEVDGELFSNTPESDHYLVKSRSSYMGGQRQGWSNFWNAALKTADSIRTGLPQAKLDWTSMSEERLVQFFRGILPNNIAVGQDLIQRHNFTSSNSLIDVGGGSGGIAIAVAQAYPHMNTTVVEVSNVTLATRRFVEEAGLENRVRVVAVDAVNEPLHGPYNVAVLQRFIQVLSSDDALKALRNVYNSLGPGGSIYVYGSIVDNSHLSPLEHAVESSLNLINSFDHGQPYSQQEYFDWLDEAGFEGYDCETLLSNQVCIRGQRPR